MQETRVWSLGREDSLEKGKTTQSSILAWRIPWTEEPGGLQSMGSQRVRSDWAINTRLKYWECNFLQTLETCSIIAPSPLSPALFWWRMLHQKWAGTVPVVLSLARRKEKGAGIYSGLLSKIELLRAHEVEDTNPTVRCNGQGVYVTVSMKTCAFLQQCDT